VLDALLPFNETVTRALPAATPRTGTATLLSPRRKETDAGDFAMVVSLLTLSVAPAVGMDDSLAVKVPVSPTVMVRESGSNCRSGRR
jgi:hypothetical protein